MITRREMLQSSAAMIGVCAASSGFAKPRTPAHTALYWDSMGDDNVSCNLCPIQCILPDGKTGFCRTRENVKGTLVTHAYANPCAVAVDPIEKKPIFHMMPGSTSYSMAIAGCMLRCLNCQNYTISQQAPQDTATTSLPPEQVVEQAKRQGCRSIAYTYAEPIVWFEYVLDTAKLARAAGIRNILVTDGYINEPPLKELAPFIDAANINLKSFKNTTYLKLNSAKLQPVMDTILNAVKFGIWVEVTNLVVPTWTDDLDMIKSMCAWHKENLGADVPLHFLRFFPLYKLQNLYPTPTATLVAARKIAREAGINYVYVGNVAELDSNTYCPHCKKPVVVRDGYIIKHVAIKDGKCENCGTVIKGIWT